MRFTVYLFNESVKQFRDAIVEKKLRGDESYRDVTPSQPSTSFEYKLYLQANKSKRPRWLKFIENFSKLDDTAKQKLQNQVNSFVALVKTRGKYFAVTGGFGFNAIDRDKIEENFGLIVTLNSLDPSKIKFFDVKNIDVNMRQKRVITSAASEVRDFELDFNQDLVRAVAGKPIEESLGKRLQGADSLSLTADVTFSDLGEMCERLLDEFNKTVYKEHFGFIDNITPIKRRPTMRQLDLKLLDAIRRREHQGVSVAYPD